MTDQEMADHIAQAAQVRFLELLKLKIRHVHELTAGVAHSRLQVEGSEVQFRLVQSAQVYKDLPRFLAPDKLVGFVLTPGVLPLVKALSMEVRGRHMLVTRPIAGEASGVSAELPDFGIRVSLSHDADAGETRLLWECLFGVA